MTSKATRQKSASRLVYAAAGPLVLSLAVLSAGLMLVQLYRLVSWLFA